MLRKEKGISQRQAAQELHISQALLSHYEKAIRECNLDFVKKAAQYYGVTSDFLLGLTESKHGLGDLYTDESDESDAELTTKSILRALIYYSEKAAGTGDAALEYFSDYFCAAVKLYAESLGADTKQLRLSGICLQLITDAQRASHPKPQNLTSPSAAAATVLKHAQTLVEETVRSITNG